MPPAMQRYILSSSVTFLATFLTLLAANLQQISNPSTLTTGLIISLIMVAGRGAVKALVEHIVSGNADLPSVGSTKQQ